MLFYSFKSTSVAIRANLVCDWWAPLRVESQRKQVIYRTTLRAPVSAQPGDSFRRSSPASHQLLSYLLTYLKKKIAKKKKSKKKICHRFIINVFIYGGCLK